MSPRPLRVWPFKQAPAGAVVIHNQQVAPPHQAAAQGPDMSAACRRHRQLLKLPMSSAPLTFVSGATSTPACWSWRLWLVYAWVVGCLGHLWSCALHRARYTGPICEHATTPSERTRRCTTAAEHTSRCATVPEHHTQPLRSSAGPGSGKQTNWSQPLHRTQLYALPLLQSRFVTTRAYALQFTLAYAAVVPPQ
jgi:hypothetical protein